MAIHCELVRFNPRRAARGVGAAEVEIGEAVLWMTKGDIRKNIEQFGPLAGLLLAKERYKSPRNEYKREVAK